MSRSNRALASGSASVSSRLKSRSAPLVGVLPRACTGNYVSNKNYVSKVFSGVPRFWGIFALTIEALCSAARTHAARLSAVGGRLWPRLNSSCSTQAPCPSVRRCPKC